MITRHYTRKQISGCTGEDVRGEETKTAKEGGRKKEKIRIEKNHEGKKIGPGVVPHWANVIKSSTTVSIQTNSGSERLKFNTYIFILNTGGKKGVSEKRGCLN